MPPRDAAQVEHTPAARPPHAGARAAAPAPAPPIAAVRDPQVGGANAQMTESRGRRDPGLRRVLADVRPGAQRDCRRPADTQAPGRRRNPPAPTSSEPSSTRATVEARVDGAADAVAPMGEAAVLPTVPPEKLRAEIAGAGRPAARR